MGDAMPDPAATAKAAGLRYVLDDEPGYARKRWGRGFTYLTPAGEHLKDEKELQRVRALAIPPAWREVWVCTSPKGHLQATGRDEQGRKQYLYHPRWREARDEAKYAHMITFAERLPAIRARVQRDLSLPGLPRDKVLAAVVRLLETSHIRVGNDEYARNNDAYGLTTIRKKHVDVEGATVSFDFQGKSGKPWHVEVKDQRLAQIIRDCQETPGYELFKYFDDADERQDVKAADVNEYLRRVSGAEITAKDFRTWTGTVLAVRALSAFEAAESERQAKKNLSAAIKEVAEHLGNTPAICRQSYIHPRVMSAYLEGELDLCVASTADQRTDLSEEEAAVLAFLKAQLEPS